MLRFHLILPLSLFSAAAFAQSVPLAQDAYVIPGSAGNFGSQQALQVGSATNARSLLLFDLTALPAGTTRANIAKAGLVLFANTATSGAAIDVSTAKGTWQEMAVTGNNAPVAGTPVASGVSAAAKQYVYVDVTSAVQSWIAVPSTNNGFLIAPHSSADSIEFDSKESTATSHSAELLITLNSLGPAGGFSGVMQTATVPANGVINCPCAVFYLIGDHTEVTLPSATTPGQVLIIADTALMRPNTFRIQALKDEDILANDTPNGAPWRMVQTRVYLISDGKHRWLQVN